MDSTRSKDIRYSLTPRGNRLYVTWWEGGKQYRVSTGTSDRVKAETYLRQFQHGRETPLPPAEPTVADLLAGYLADRTPRVASPETLRHACTALSRHLGYMLPSTLSRQVCRTYHMSRRTEGWQAPGSKRRKPIGAGTIIRELVTLRAALRWGLGEGWITVEPYIELPKAPAAKTRWLTREEAERLLGATDAPHVYLFMMLGLYTGARMGALIELRWDQVDFTAERIDFGAGKGNKRRAIVPMTVALRTALAEAYPARTTDRVIEYGGLPVRSVRKGVASACQRAGLPGVGPHTLRHTAASWMVQAGVSAEEVGVFLGNSAAIVERVYGHFSPEYLADATRALSQPPARVRRNP